MSLYALYGRFFKFLVLDFGYFGAILPKNAPKYPFSVAVSIYAFFW